MMTKNRRTTEVEEPTPIEIRDQWFKDVPEVGTAYWLKEDFSDILQLWDRRKAEELTDLWLGRVEEFIRQLRSKYQQENGRQWNCPFTNVLTTIKTWRPYILNYVDSKNRYSLTATNFFAEHVNNKIKMAKSLSKGIAFETVRTKAVHGGVMVKRRPPHPLSEPQVRSRPRRRGKKNGEVNPDSNLEQLKLARESMDETKDLLPKPQESPEWASRFGWAGKSSSGRSPARPEPRKNEDVLDRPAPTDRPASEGTEVQSLNPDRATLEPALKTANDTQAAVKRVGKGKRKPTNSDANQPTMF